MLPVQAAEIVNTFLGEPAFVILQQSIAKDAICGSIGLGDGVSCGLEFHGVFPRKKGRNGARRRDQGFFNPRQDMRASAGFHVYRVPLTASEKRHSTSHLLR